MRKVTVKCTWESYHTIEVEDDFDLEFKDWPDDMGDLVTSQTADLVDWEVTTRDDGQEVQV